MTVSRPSSPLMLTLHVTPVASREAGYIASTAGLWAASFAVYSEVRGTALIHVPRSAPRPGWRNW